MGLRATIVKKYDVQYGDAAGFNYGYDFLAALIGEYCASSYLGGENNSCEALWEVDKEEFKAMVATLKEMDADEFAEKAVSEWGACEEDGYTKDYVLHVFERWLEETDPNSCWIRFGWL